MSFSCPGEYIDARDQTSKIGENGHTIVFLPPPPTHTYFISLCEDAYGQRSCSSQNEIAGLEQEQHALQEERNKANAAKEAAETRLEELDRAYKQLAQEHAALLEWVPHMMLKFGAPQPNSRLSKPNSRFSLPTFQGADWTASRQGKSAGVSRRSDWNGGGLARACTAGKFPNENCHTKYICTRAPASLNQRL